MARGVPPFVTSKKSWLDPTHILDMVETRYVLAKSKPRLRLYVLFTLFLSFVFKHVNVLFQNAYTATAINGTNFCTSAKDTVAILAKSSTNTMAINCFGDFIIFLGKVSKVLSFP